MKVWIYNGDILPEHRVEEARPPQVEAKLEESDVTTEQGEIP